MPGFRVIMVPPEDQPQTFADTNAATGEAIERDAIRDIVLNALNEDAARLLCERQAFDIATQEVANSGEFTDEQVDESMEAVMKRQWRIQSITQVGDGAAPPAPTEAAPAE